MKPNRTWGRWVPVITLIVTSCAVSPDPLVDPTKHPTITSIQVPSTQVSPGSTLDLSVVASSPDDSRLKYQWSVSGGTISNPSSPNPVWVAPMPSGFGVAGTITFTVRVYDDKGRQASRQFQVTVLNS